MNNMLFKKPSFIQFLIVFAAVFLLCYYGALFITGLAIPGGMYSPFAEKYFNIAAWFRSSLIGGTKVFVAVFDYKTIRTSEYVLRVPGANGIRIVYSCLGFGVMSFWAAYMVATSATLVKKAAWLLAGVLLIWFINVVRISLVLIASNKGWKFPFGWDHHRWFNIAAYLFIFCMMYFFEKNIKQTSLHAG
ncbi:MAG: exosortase/archaeosortase family protein [Ferruginibacter sp.]